LSAWRRGNKAGRGRLYVDGYLDIGQCCDGDAVRLAVCGESDFATTGSLRDRLLSAQGSGQPVQPARSQVSFMHSAAINLLAQAADRPRILGGSP
jgi:hypothetical protein